MAKHKKTLAQKKKTDSRKHYSPPQENATGHSSTSTFSLSEYSFASTSKHATSSVSQTSFGHDLQKTLIVSSTIVIVQLAIFFLLSHHILILPWRQITY